MSRNKKQTSVIDKKAKQYTSRHHFDGDQIELYIECQEAKIRAFKAGAEWKQKEMIEKAAEWVKKNLIHRHESPLEIFNLLDDFKQAMMEE